MREKREFLLYTGMWIVAVLVLVGLLIQNLGNARIINYSGIVRGATQQLVKEELAGQRDDVLIQRLDGIIFDLQTGKGEYDLNKNEDKEYQAMLAELNQVWQRIKGEIDGVRAGGSGETLFALSQRHFGLADRMVLCAEEGADAKLIRSIAFYVVILILSVVIFTFVNRRSRHALKESIYTDHLTGLPNRAGFESAAADLLRDGTDYAIVELDLDDFKFINSMYGYEFGDRVLCCIADALRMAYGGGQLCARVGADDFLVLARRRDDLLEALSRLITGAMQERLQMEMPDFVTITLGGYNIDARGEAVQAMMDKATIAHKTAKRQGKGSALWYNEKLLETLRMENNLKNRMHKALGGGEFQMFLQPKVDLHTMAVIGAEALVRWQTPEYGMVYPDQFIPLMERSGTIVDLDFYMLEQACLFLKRRMESGMELLGISVNFSRVTILRRDFCERMMQVVDRYGIPHGSIEVEVTESAFNEIPQAVITTLVQLKEKGFVLSMDDFGSGYSSLNQLDKLPIQVLKLDREFLWELQDMPRVKGVIICVVDLAHVLGMRVVCEGVEQPAHLQFLQEIGCDYGQGYYFAKPLPQQEFIQRYELPASCGLPQDPEELLNNMHKASL